jgi:hypothetical protein
MSLINQAKADIEAITSNLSEFGVEMTLTAPTSETATITGLHTKHHLGITTDGDMVSTKKAHVSFSEKFLTDLNYPVRDENGEVNLTNHTVAVKDSTGNVCNYFFKQWFPDETIGLIACILDVKA